MWTQCHVISSSLCQQAATGPQLSDELVMDSVKLIDNCRKPFNPGSMTMQNGNLPRRHLVNTLLSLQLFVFSVNASAANACKGIGGSWSISGTGPLTLSQDPTSGTISSGLLTTSDSGAGCNSGQHYTISGPCERRIVVDRHVA